MKQISVVTCAAVVIGLLGIAHAQFGKPEDAIQYRKSAMSLMGHHFKGMAMVVKGQRDYDREGFSREATLFETLSKLPWEAFAVEGSDKGDTTMTAAALKNPDAFREETRRFEDAVGAYIQAAESGNLDAIRNTFGRVAKSCKSCHEAFRKK